MKYSDEEKLSIVARCQQGESVAALSDELAIPRSTLYRGLKSFPTDSAGKPLKNSTRTPNETSVFEPPYLFVFCFNLKKFEFKSLIFALA